MDYRQGKYLPSQDKFQKIADFFKFDYKTIEDLLFNKQFYE